MNAPNLLGVTIGAGDGFADMAALAAHRFTVCTGAPAVVLSASEWKGSGLPKPHHLKFELFKLYPDADELVFFDADLVFCEPFALDELRSVCGFAAVPDIAEAPWIICDADRAGVPAPVYFNSGLFWIHRDRARVLTDARELWESGKITSPFQDQTFLNAAARESGPVRLLDRRFNYHVDPVHTHTLEGVIGAHFHGIAKDRGRLVRYYHEPRSMFWRRSVAA